MAIVKNIRSRISRRALLIDLWYLTSGCDSCRQKDTLAAFRNWKRRGLSSGRESLCFRCKSIAHRGSRQNRAKSFDFDWPIFNVAVYKRAQFLLDERRIVIFLRISTLTWPMQPRVGNTTVGWKDDNRCHRVFFHYCVSGRKRFIFLAVPRISGIPNLCNGALNAFPLLECYHVSKYEVEVWQ